MLRLSLCDFIEAIRISINEFVYNKDGLFHKYERRKSKLWNKIAQWNDYNSMVNELEYFNECSRHGYNKLTGSHMKKYIDENKVIRLHLTLVFLIER